jgi:hypothetical protein
MFRGKEDQRPDTLPEARITSENRRGNPPDQKHNATQQYEIKNNEPEQEPILCDECSQNEDYWGNVNSVARPTLLPSRSEHRSPTFISIATKRIFSFFGSNETFGLQPHSTRCLVLGGFWIILAAVPWHLGKLLGEIRGHLSAFQEFLTH